MTGNRLEKNRKLVECALLIAIATVLSLFSIFALPYGGSVTLASMLPLVLIAYRSGILWGLASGLVYGIIQQLLGLKNLSYFTTWQSIVAIILLDYLIAFAVLGLGGIFRNRLKKQSMALAVGSAFVCLLRYLCHVVSGATVWAGLSIPTQAALAYSFVYNATYMIPETIVLVLVAYYLGSVFDFEKEIPSRVVRDQKNTGGDLMALIAGFIGLGALIFDVANIFGHMQDSESGEFNISLLFAKPFVKSFWLQVTVVTVVALAIVCVLIILRKKTTAQNADEAGSQNA